MWGSTCVCNADDRQYRGYPRSRTSKKVAFLVTYTECTGLLNRHGKPTWASIWLWSSRPSDSAQWQLGTLKSVKDLGQGLDLCPIAYRQSYLASYTFEATGPWWHGAGVCTIPCYFYVMITLRQITTHMSSDNTKFSRRPVTALARYAFGMNMSLHISTVPAEFVTFSPWYFSPLSFESHRLPP